jgi:hypothetical protein
MVDFPSDDADAAVDVAAVVIVSVVDLCLLSKFIAELYSFSGVLKLNDEVIFCKIIVSILSDY